VKIDRREIWEVNMLLPDGKHKPHPCIVLSGQSVLESEEAALVVMLTTSGSDDEFSFYIENEMITYKPTKQNLQARVQLIMLTPLNQFSKRFGYIKQPYFEKLIEQINTVIFKG
jgi:hypothetical protein